METLKNEFKRIKYNSPVILSFAILSAMSLILGYMTNGKTTVLLFSVYRSSPIDILSYIRIFGHILGHADWNHYFSNFLIILLVGPMLEEKYGSKNILLIMIFTAFVTSILHLALSNYALLGASGIAFTFILLSSLVNFQNGEIPLTFIFVAFIFIGREIVEGALLNDNISHLTHIIGGACGCASGFFLNRKNF